MVITSSELKTLIKSIGLDAIVKMAQTTNILLQVEEDTGRLGKMAYGPSFTNGEYRLADGDPRFLKDGVVPVLSAIRAAVNMGIVPYVD